MTLASNSPGNSIAILKPACSEAQFSVWYFKVYGQLDKSQVKIRHHQGPTKIDSRSPGHTESWPQYF